MAAVFEMTGDAEKYSSKLVKLMMMIGARWGIGIPVAASYAKARPGFPPDWRTLLDAMFGFDAGST
jgi:hypothetical protein